MTTVFVVNHVDMQPDFLVNMQSVRSTGNDIKCFCLPTHKGDFSFSMESYCCFYKLISLDLLNLPKQFGYHYPVLQGKQFY